MAAGSPTHARVSAVVGAGAFPVTALLLDELRGRILATEDPAVRARLRIRLAERLAAAGDAASAATELARLSAASTASEDHGALSGAMVALAARGISARFGAGPPPRQAAGAPSVATPPAPRAARGRERGEPRSAGGAGKRSAPPGPPGATAGGPRADEGAATSSHAAARPPVSSPAAAEVARSIGEAGGELAIAPAGGPAAGELGRPRSLVEAARAAWAEGKSVRARRLAVEAARLEAHQQPDVEPRLLDLADSMTRAGFARDGLLVRRALLERPDAAGVASAPSGVDAPAAVSAFLADLARRAVGAGELELGRAWSGDAGAVEIDDELVAPVVAAGRADETLARVDPNAVGPPPAPPAPLAPTSAFAAWRAYERWLLTRATGAAPPGSALGSALVSEGEIPRDLDLAGTGIPGVVALGFQKLAAGGEPPWSDGQTASSATRPDGLGGARGAWTTRLLWQRAFEAEAHPSSRAAVGARWVAAEMAAARPTSSAEGSIAGPRTEAKTDSATDVPGAGPARETLLGILNLIIASVPVEAPAELRRLRRAILRGSGDLAQLAVALGEDAEHAPEARARADLRAAEADVWEELGDAELALELRLRALSESPDARGALAPALRRLEAEGRRAESLGLLSAAVEKVTAPAERLVLLRELGRCAAMLPGGRRKAASAWLEVLKHDPDDLEARQGAERMLAETQDHARLSELLSWACAREQQPARRADSLWRLAEFRRVERRDVAGALSLYRQIAELAAGAGPSSASSSAAASVPASAAPSGSAAAAGPANAPTSAPSRAATEPLTFADEDWRRRDDMLALHTARALAAPRPAQKAMALVDRANVLIEAGRLDAADRDLGRAMDLDIANPSAMVALERLSERRGDFRAFRQRLQGRLASATGTVAAQLWFGIGRASERLEAEDAALAAYANAVAADPRFAPALAALRRHAQLRGEHAQAVQFLEREVELAQGAADVSAEDRLALHVELGIELLDKLHDAPRAAEVLEVALALDPVEPRALRAMFEARLELGGWEAAAQALETMLTANVGVDGAADHYYRVGRAAEAMGAIDRALTFYSRSYSRMTSYRPTLERLSEICFERQQWDNAWRATEHLRDRHGADLDATTRAHLALRAGLSDLHVAQRTVAIQKVGGMLSDTAAGGGGLRDVADSWASMRLEPRLLVGIESERRGRILARLGEVMSLTEGLPAHPARQGAREILAALALADQRWADALAFLEALAVDPAVEAGKRAAFWLTAGDIVRTAYGDTAGARARYRSAAALWPAHPGLRREPVAALLGRQDP